MRSSQQFNLSRPSALYLVLFVLQLVFMLLWISSIQREQHGDTAGIDNLNAASRQASVNSRLLDALTAKKCDCTKECAKTGTAAVATVDCGTRVNEAIMQLETLKSEMHGGVVTATPSSAAASTRKPFLIIGIPSMPRAADYLTGVLAAIDRQLVHDPSDPMFNSIQVWVMNNVKKESGATFSAHPVFDQNKSLYTNRVEFRFLTNDHSLSDANPQDRDPGMADRPGWQVRKQTRDIVRLMQMAKEESQYYMAMEDDFELCPHTLRIIEHALRKAAAAQLTTTTPMQEFITMKFSYGFNGFLLHNNGDLIEFARYLIEHQARRPPVSCAHARIAASIQLERRAHTCIVCCLPSGSSDNRMVMQRETSSVSRLRGEVTAACVRCDLVLTAVDLSVQC